LIIVALIIVLLIAGREILEPLVIAGLLAFILSPLIRRLRLWGVWRVPSVVLAVLFALGLIGALSTILALQVTQLAEDLPTYETNIRNKIRALGVGRFTSGALDRASNTLKDLQEELARAGPQSNDRRPLLVEVQQTEPKGLESIARLVRPLLSPLAMGALTILFLIFILLEREDIRDRFLRLAGTHDLQRSTAALDDAGSRLSRFFLMQTLLNTGFGIFIACALWIIGVPNALLWGMFAGLMRFVPFVGGLIAAFFPITLAIAVDPGWTMALSVATLFLIAEPVAGHVIEPLLYGQHTGLSPVAIVISTLFWTLVWGPMGLLLATPLTVCLVVLGAHIEGLRFIEVLLGDEPALEPHERFYQRMLAGDDTEAADLAEKELKTQRLAAYYDAVALPALALAQADAARGRLSHDKQVAIFETVEDVVEDLSDYDDRDPAAEQDADDNRLAIDHASLQGRWAVEHPVLCVASRSPLDQAACTMLGQLLGKHGLATRIASFSDVASARSFKIHSLDAPLICLSYFGSAKHPAHVRYLIRRLRRAMPDARFAACFWMLVGNEDKAEEWRVAVGADLVATTLTAAIDICVREARPNLAPAATTRGNQATKTTIPARNDQPAMEPKH
jgi:predicted PurR-regulated permease PerM